MSNLVEEANNNIQKFKLISEELLGESNRYKMAYLSNLKSTFPAYETFDSFAKPNCFIFDENGVIFASLDDQLIHKQNIETQSQDKFGEHRDIFAIKASIKHDRIITVSKNGLFMIWHYKSKTLIKTVETFFTQVSSIEIKNENQFFLINKNDVILLDHSKEIFVSITEQPEGHRFAEQEQWESIKIIEQPLPENQPEHAEDISGERTIPVELENDIIKKNLKFLELNKQLGKKARKSSINRQNFLTSMIDFKKSPVCRMIYIQASQVLYWTNNKTIFAVDFQVGKFIPGISVPSSVTCISSNNDETILFFGLKTGEIKFYDARDLTELGELIGHTNEITSIINSRGKHLLVFSAAKDDSVRVWHLKLLEEIGQLISPQLRDKDSGEPIRKKAQSLKELADAVKLEKIKKFKKGKNEISDLSFSPDEEFLYCIFNNETLKWKINFNYKEFEYENQTIELTKSIFVNKSPQMMITQEDQKIVQINIIDNTKMFESQPIDQPIGCLSISKNDQIIAVGQESGFVVFLNGFKLTTMFEVKISESSIDKIEFFRDRYAIIVDSKGDIFVYDTVRQENEKINKYSQIVTAIIISDTLEIMFTATNELILRKWDLKPLSNAKKPSEVYFLPIELPIISMSIDVKRNILYFSQREIVHAFEIDSQESVQEIYPENMIEFTPIVRAASKINSTSNIRNSLNMDEFVFDLVSSATKEEFAVKSILQLSEHNLVILARENGNITCWDSATRETLLEFSSHKKIQSLVKPSSGNLFYLLNEDRTIECINVFRLNFFDCCYIQTFTEKMNDFDFLKKMESFHELAKDSPFIYKILHPLYIAFLLNKFGNIDWILKNWGYPVLNGFQPSPLILSLEGRHVNFAESLFRELTLYKGHITYRYLEIQCMLEHDYKFVKKLLVKCCEKVDCFTNNNDKIKKFNSLTKSKAQFLSYSGHFTKKNFDEFAFSQIREIQMALSNPERGVEMDLDNEEMDQLIDNKKILNVKEQNIVRIKGSMKNTYTEVYRINGFYNFKEGSDDILNFLYRFSQSSIDEFVLSNWNKIITHKWEDCQNYFRVLGCTFFAYLIFLNLYILNPVETVYLYINSILLTLLLVYEIIPLIFSPQYYLNDPSNLIDLLTYIMGVATIIFIRVNPDPDNIILQTVEVVTISLTFFRGISYLQIFESMRSMTHMINRLFIGVLDVLVMIFYLLITITVLMNIVADEHGFYGNFVWAVYMSFCNFPSEFDISYIHLFVLMTAMFCLTLIIINFMIAKMANTYNELEKKQKATSIKQMAKILFEFEIWFRIFYLKRSDRKYMTYYIFSAIEPDFDEGELKNGSEEISDLIDLKASLVQIGEQLERIEAKSNNFSAIKKEVITLQSKYKFHDSHNDIRAINQVLGNLVNPPFKKN